MYSTVQNRKRQHILPWGLGILWTKNILFLKGLLFESKNPEDFKPWIMSIVNVYYIVDQTSKGMPMQLQ